MTPSVDSSHWGKWFALLFHVKSVMITFHITEIQLKELHEWYTAYLQLRTSVVYLFKTNQPLKWWLLFFCQTTDFFLKYLVKSVFQEELTVLNLKLSIYENHVCELRSEGRSSQLYTQVLQLRKESLKKKPESFSGFLFPTAKVACITAMIFLHVVLNLLPAVENQNWHWPGPARCDLLLIINKLFRDPTPYIRKSPSLQNNVATERAASSSQG